MMEEDSDIEIIPNQWLPFLLALKADKDFRRNIYQRMGADLNLTNEQKDEVVDCLLELLLDIDRSN
jgi:hypothetical protein